MKKFIKISSIIASIVLLLSLYSCNIYKGPYIFWRQDRSNIAKIEICSYDCLTRKRTVISELPKEATDYIIDEISTYSCYQFFGDHPREYSKVILCITYLDGEIELISFVNFGYITPDGEQNILSYALDAEYSYVFFNLMCKYVDRELLSEMKIDAPHWFVDESGSN